MENRLIAITPQVVESGSKKAEFKYDYRGRRVRKTVSEHDGYVWVEVADLLFIYDGWNVVLVLDANDSNAITHQYTWGLDLSQSMQGAGGIGGLLAGVDTQGTTTTEDDEPYWYLYDANGNVGQLVRYDDTGPTITLAAHYEYDPYGNPIAAVDVDATGLVTANPFRFSTKWLDSELAAQGQAGAIGPVGLYYYGYRYYAPALGRWINWDPIGHRGGLNLYRYVMNSPLVAIDPLGLQSQFVVPGITIKRNHAKWLAVFGIYQKSGDLYGHWWTEMEMGFGVQHSYGWWPTVRLSGLVDTIKGVGGDLNGQTAFGGTPTRDPHHGDAADEEHGARKAGAIWEKLKYGNGKGLRCSCLDAKAHHLLFKDCIAKAAADFGAKNSVWKYPGKWNCHNFQDWLLRQCCLTIDVHR